MVFSLRPAVLELSSRLEASLLENEENENV